MSKRKEPTRIPEVNITGSKNCALNNLGGDYLREYMQKWRKIPCKERNTGQHDFHRFAPGLPRYAHAWGRNTGRCRAWADTSREVYAA